MNATTIDYLAAADPTAPIARAGSIRAPFEVDHNAVKRFVHRYTNPAFGWFIAGRYASMGKAFPVTLVGNDVWVHKAWMMRCNQDRWFDPHIAEALAMATLSELQTTGETVKAAILSTCVDPLQREAATREVAATTGVHPRTLDAFEALFYNIYDRSADNLYLAKELYPHTRLVELREDYAKTVSAVDLMKRAAYNHKDLRMTLYLAGVGDASYLAKLSERPDREQELAKRIMGNALILSYAGLLNQRSVGLSRGQSLLAASRQGGVQEQETPVANVGTLLVDQMQALALAHHKTLTDMVRADHELTLDAEIVEA